MNDERVESAGSYSTQKLILDLKGVDYYEADLKTERLMMLILGKDYIRAENLEDFPCEELKEMDDICKNYTGYTFSLSVLRDFIYKGILVSKFTRLSRG